jgi:NADH:ubiquinone oxidoreductase subunit 3 (subunit A)
MVFLKEYLIVILALLLISLLAFVIFSISFFFVNKSIDLNKNSIYECGFEPFEDSRNMFDVKFYLVSIFFIIFDLEIVFLIPWVLSYMFLNYVSFFFLFIFCFFLILIYIYEWRIGALVWSK